MKSNHKFVTILFFVVALVGLVFLSLKSGKVNLSWASVFDFLTLRSTESDAFILWEVRLPRTLMAFLLGSTLGLGGAAMQGLVRNPLAEPGMMGVTGGAVLGATLVFYTGAFYQQSLLLPFGGILGAGLSVFFLLLFSKSWQRLETFILAGVAINAVCFALTSLLLNLIPNPYAVTEVLFWQMGSVADRSWTHVLTCLPFVLGGWVLLLWDRKVLDLLSLGSQVTETSGVSLKSVQMRIVLGLALSVGACVAFCGSVGFVGLVIPHLVRPLVKYQPAKLLSLSALGGGALVLAADLLIRLLPTQTELKLGVLTALIGAPFFIYLLFSIHRRGRV